MSPWLLSNAGGARPVWSPSGQELFYEAPGGALMAVRVDPRGATWNAGNPAKVLEGPYLNQGGGIRNYDVSADGRRFLVVKLPANPGAAAQIVVAQNWTEELKHLVPVH